MTTPVGEPHYFICRSYRDLAEGELPDRTVLDSAAPGHPVFIQAWAPVTPNVCAMNSLALRRLGISRDTPDRVDNVWIKKDSTGEPTGRLHGSVTNYYCDSSFMHELVMQLPLLQFDAVVPVAPSIWTAYRTDRPTGISPGTWLLILAELLCWGVYGLHKSDPRLTVLGYTDVVASLLMLARARHARKGLNGLNGNR
ncbi:MAG: hypothetical protein M0007_03785 [Actinomycetota bacterium]|nr:hypothetical protein [Actinomycetota bacterium]